MTAFHRYVKQLNTLYTARFEASGHNFLLAKHLGIEIAAHEEHLLKRLKIGEAMNKGGKLSPELVDEFSSETHRIGEFLAVEKLYARLMALPKEILVDMDSIWADFYFGVLEEYERETGDKPKPDALGHWDAKLPNGKDCYEYFKQPGFFRKLKQIHGATAFIQKARAAGHDVMICTSATLTNAPGEKFEWISEVLPDFDRKQVIFSSRKARVLADLLIDDHADNTGPFMKRQPSSETIGIEYPYNVSRHEEFTHLVPSYLDFEGAWARIDKLVFG